MRIRNPTFNKDCLKSFNIFESYSRLLQTKIKLVTKLKQCKTIMLSLHSVLEDVGSVANSEVTSGVYNSLTYASSVVGESTGAEAVVGTLNDIDGVGAGIQNW
ncbi:ABC transporter related protein [Candida maltosa Xu316]|uniref:ABC transporter related protein n=1 Tax=Candida maltosa (strain Xu316) TaxID=1245528 RepID=M3JY58_CANMX|nr:ABC transporter related protein [Candida maltosa Xu316]